ncbi:MAG: Gp15 family bacteriophage protein [Clostridia bacterium]|nr:Gp15 family bacteriophage protein [Clostridia bacterium]
MLGELPRSLEVNGKEFKIRTDYRDVLKIVSAFNDRELEDDEKVYICLVILFKDFDKLKKDDYEAAFKAALSFIDCGQEPNNSKPAPHIMDWEQDEKIIFPAINKAAGFEVRTAKYVHWWTFIGYYMEIPEGIFSHVLSLRLKKAKGKRLEKWEKEFWSANKEICVIKTKLTKEEQAEKDKLNALLD